MARIRTVKPEFWTDEKLALLPALSRLVFLGLVSQADDAGRLVDNVKLLDGLLFPYTDDSCADALTELAAMGRILRYRSDSGQPLIQVVNWERHQKVANPSKYVLPAPPASEGRRPSCDSHETLMRSSGSDPRSPIGDHGPTTNDQQNPPGVALAREALDPGTDLPDEEPDDEPLPEVPADRGAKVVPLRPPAPPEALPFGGLDWEGRVSGAVVLREWINLQPTPPGRSDRDRFGQACKRIADEHTTGEIALAFLGMGALWPHAPPRSEPWTPEHLRKRFVEALAMAANHPTLARMREDAEFDRAFEHATNGRKA